MQKITKLAGLLGALGLSACTMEMPPAPVAAPVAASSTVLPPLPPDIAARNFAQAADAVEPVAEAACRARRTVQNCDFLILVDDRPDQPANAFQTLDETGRPLLVFTLPLIADARNIDEIAFVIGHEAAHHIEGHIPDSIAQARNGALAAGLLAAILTGGAEAGVRQSAIDQAVQAGAYVGGRRFSKQHELEADALGTRIAASAGFDPVRGSAFFTRLPDPGDRFLGSHPPNTARIETVRQTAASL